MYLKKKFFKTIHYVNNNKYMYISTTNSKYLNIKCFKFAWFGYVFSIFPIFENPFIFFKFEYENLFFHKII